MSFAGDSIAIFIKWERLFSPVRFLNLVLMSFICEKLGSTEAVPVVTGIDKHTFDRALRFGNMVTSMSFLTNSLSWGFCPLPTFLKESSERFSILCVLQM